MFAIIHLPNERPTPPPNWTNALDTKLIECVMRLSNQSLIGTGKAIRWNPIAQELSIDPIDCENRWTLLNAVGSPAINNLSDIASENMSSLTGSDGNDSIIYDSVTQSQLVDVLVDQVTGEESTNIQ